LIGNLQNLKIIIELLETFRMRYLECEELCPFGMWSWKMLERGGEGDREKEQKI